MKKIQNDIGPNDSHTNPNTQTTPTQRDNDPNNTQSTLHQHDQHLQNKSRTKQTTKSRPKNTQIINHYEFDRCSY